MISPHASQGNHIPVDTHAERGVVGCWCRGYRDDELDLDWFHDGRLKLMLLSVDTLHMTGEAIVPVDPYSYHELREVGRANAELGSYLLERSGVWDYVDDPRYLYGQCLGMATMPQCVDWYVNRMREVAHQRRRIWEAESALRSAWEAVV